MINTFENLSNEIILLIFSEIKWFEMIESFWSLNKRFNSLIYFKFSINRNEIIINKRCLSFNYKKILRFVNLKKLILNECYLTLRLIENLSLLIEYQLDELILTFDDDIFKSCLLEKTPRMFRYDQESKLTLMFREFVHKLLSDKCKLISLDLDMSNDNTTVNIHQCFSLYSDIYLKKITNKFVTSCTSLRYLSIHLIYGYFLENIIEHIPSLEILSVIFKNTLMNEWYSYEPSIKRCSSNIFNWYEKIPKLKYFSLKSRIIGDDELIYLKLIINKVNYIEKLKIRLNIKESMNDNCIIDGNFLDKYLMINILNNLIDFDFYIVSKCKMLFSNDIQKIINSFKIHRFFNDYHWKNIQCFFDKNMSYQHISSNEIIFKPKYFCVRPKYREGYRCQVMSRKWIESLRTSESIVKHVTVFEENLCQLVEQLKQFVYLDIYGQTDQEKIEPYRSMVHKSFPNSRLIIDISRFRLWF
ncbi:unnamed protein product [Rotaria sordida]|uniref:F-box domain-containing protein n=1 Tax=Rotaria sordida TaxID=392033 RepID=A0A813Y888_9BILA|nr:unnamed protein product [Rotaria sordida]